MGKRRQGELEATPRPTAPVVASQLALCPCRRNSQETWVEQPDPRRTGEFVTTCGRCGRFIGRRHDIRRT